jgi:hypothetical protein
MMFACSAYDEASPNPTPSPDDAGADAPSNSDTGGTVTPTWLPTPGTYRYHVDGLQRLSVGAPEYRDEDPVAPAVIENQSEPGCWRLRLCLVSGKCDDAPAAAYSEIAWTFCVSGGHLEQRGAREVTQWFAVGSMRKGTSQVECAPGQALYATTDLTMTSWSHVCSGHVDGNYSFSTGGPYRYLGEDSVIVGTASVRAYHYAEEHTVSANELGAPAGKQIGEWWLAPNGLPLRIRRGASIDTNIGFGTVEFRQGTKTPYDAGGNMTMDDCVLDSLEPSPLPDAGN